MLIKDITKKEWNGKTFWEVTLEDGTKGSCWQPEFAKYQAGQVVDFDIQRDAKNNVRFRLKDAKPSGGGFRGKSPEELAQQQKTMVLAYAKDLTIELIKANGVPTTTEEAVAIWNKVYDEGMKIVRK